MLKILDLFKRKKETPEVPKPKHAEDEFLFSTHFRPPQRGKIIDSINSRVFQQLPPTPITLGGAADGMPSQGFGLNQSNLNSMNNQTLALVDWYATQSFIQYQLCAILSQQWLIDKACTMPSKDAIRKGYELTVNDGSDVNEEVLSAIREYDNQYAIRQNLLDFIRFGRIFGIRIAMFLIDSKDPEYYRKPFNADGVTPGSYKGISQIDPYWITPLLDYDASGNPMSKHFYEPTWWYVNGQTVHRSHLIIFKTAEVPDILKPTYIYGGVPIPQRIWERVYAAERTANEAPLLAMTKRTAILKVDTEAAIAKQGMLEQKLHQFEFLRSNFGVKVVGLEEDMTQLDTNLQDLDDVIMSQYQLVAAAANVPAVKLLGTSPKGFNATGEYEEASYHEELESIQAHDLTPLLDRHNLLLIRSEIAPRFGIQPFKVVVVWKSLDSMTAVEQATLNKTKADTDAVLSASGAIDGTDIRKRIINDPDSGYNGIDEDAPDTDEDLVNEEENQIDG